MQFPGNIREVIEKSKDGPNSIIDLLMVSPQSDELSNNLGSWQVKSISD